MHDIDRSEDMQLDSTSSSHSVAMGDLPVELITIVLEILCPIFRRNTNMVMEVGQLDQFNRTIKVYSELRLISTTWHQIITPFLYEEVALVTTPSTHPEFVTEFFQVRANYIHSVILVGQQSDHHRSYAAVAEAVGRGLNLCTKIQALDCRGHYAAFINRQWLPKFAPKLASTVTSLTVGPKAVEMDISYALVGLGHSIQSLAIVGWRQRGTVPLSSFHLPSKLPNLAHVGFYYGHPRVDALKRLLSRITADKTENPLRSLHIILPGLPIARFVEIMSIKNLGPRLRTLHVSAGQSIHSSLANTVLDLCPNLIDFSFASPAPKETVKRLRPSIERLELYIMQGEAEISSVDVADFLRMKICPALRTLIIQTQDNRQLADPDLLSACKDLDIQTSTTLTNTTSSMTLTLPVLMK